MENNSDRMGFALIALSVVAFVLLAVNGPLKASADGLFNGFKEWQQSTFSQINDGGNVTPPADTKKYTVVGADSSPQGDYKVPLTVDGVPVGEYSLDSATGNVKVTFSEDKAKDINLSKPLVLSYSGQMPQSNLSFNIDNVLDVDTTGSKISNSVMITAAGNNITLQGDGKSVYGVVLTWNVNSENGQPAKASVTSHYEEVK